MVARGGMRQESHFVLHMIAHTDAICIKEICPCQGYYSDNTHLDKMWSPSAAAQQRLGHRTLAVIPGIIFNRIRGWMLASSGHSRVPNLNRRPT